jgi:hypothetical protein
MNFLQSWPLKDDLALLAIVLLHSIVPYEQYELDPNSSYMPTSTIPSELMSQDRLGHTLLADAYGLFAYIIFMLPLLSFESKQTWSLTPCGHYAHFSLARRRETIETYSIFIATHTFNHVNAFINHKNNK